jgi:hypothetical protein
MTQEEQDLLLKDLSARLPYGVKFECNKNVYTAKGLDLIVTDEGDWDYAVTSKSIAPIEIEFIKPYLFPPTSVTLEKFGNEINEIGRLHLYDLENKHSEDSMLAKLELYHKNHIDYRGLIPMGLAIDATGLNIY